MWRAALLLLLFASAGGWARAQEVARPEKSVVAVAQDRRVIEDFRADPAAVRSMVDALVKEVTQKPSVAQAWAALVQPGDKVGLKVSTEGGKFFSTHRAVVEAVVRGLEQAGVPRKNVIVWDRSEAQLRAAGFLPAQSGYQVLWAEPVTGYDPRQQFASAVLGRLMWGDVKFQARPPDSPWAKAYEDEQLSSSSFLAKALIQRVTKVINLPVLSDHRQCGVAGALYNMTVRNVDNWRRFVQPPSRGDPFLAELYADERIGGKVVLTLLDGLIAQYAYGPGFEPNYAFAFGALYASRDPVAIDATALRLIDGWRKEAKLPGALEQGSYVQSAALMGLGNYDAARIDYRVLSGAGGVMARQSEKSR